MFPLKLKNSQETIFNHNLLLFSGLLSWVVAFGTKPPRASASPLCLQLWKTEPNSPKKKRVLVMPNLHFFSLEKHFTQSYCPYLYVKDADVAQATHGAQAEGSHWTPVLRLCASVSSSVD